MNRLSIVFSLVALFFSPASAQAFLGPAPAGTAIAEYDIFTGEITVSVNGVNNWFVQSVSLGLTGDSPSHTPILSGSLPSNNDQIIGETAFAGSTGTDVSLGNVAQTFLPLDDLTISWNAGLGTPLLTTPLGWIHISNDVPTAGINGPFTIDIATDPLSITLDASSTDHFISVLHLWDLDDDGFFEVNTGFIDTLPIADVAATFGGPGVYPISMKAFNGVASDIATTTITLINTPEPNTLILGTLAGLSLLVRRKRSAD